MRVEIFPCRKRGAIGAGRTLKNGPVVLAPVIVLLFCDASFSPSLRQGSRRELKDVIPSAGRWTAYPRRRNAARMLHPLIYLNPICFAAAW
jgi:hypothetical protein